MEDREMNSTEVKTKWSVLRLIRAQSGTVNWQPIVTFFPRGSISDAPMLDGMEVVREMIEMGMAEEVPQEKGVPTYRITEAGRHELARLDRLRESGAGGDR